MNDFKTHPSSYKEPAGFIFEATGKIYRQVNKRYAEDYTFCKSPNLYASLIRDRKLVAHEELFENFTGSDDWYITLIPEQIGIISYPYEWSFDQLRDTPLLTLDILKISMHHGMI